jgi:hypothetical protein
VEELALVLVSGRSATGSTSLVIVAMIYDGGTIRDSEGSHVWVPREDLPSEDEGA